MSKCGKGCMPECEYFTTGGCISPFNCSYRIEELSPNSATSVSSIYVQNLISENAVLKTENAELKARLERAIELPTIYEHIIYPFVEESYTETIYYVVYRENGRIMTINCGKNKAKAEARLEELKGDKNDR